MPEIHVKDAAITAELEAIAAEWAISYPDEHAEFTQLIAETSKNLINSSAMSRDRTHLNFCKIPKFLHDFVSYRFRKRHGIDDFFRDAANYRLLCKVWPDTRIKRQATKIA